MNTLGFQNVVPLISSSIMRPQLKTSSRNQTGNFKKQSAFVQSKPLKNTRLQYISGDAPGYFIVKIIDTETDKIIKEIPLKKFRLSATMLIKLMVSLLIKVYNTIGSFQTASHTLYSVAEPNSQWLFGIYALFL